MTRAGLGATLYRPGTVGEATQILAALAEADRPADLLSGGTDLVPALRSGARRPGAVVALRRVLELRARGAGADSLTVGAGVTYTELTGWSLSPGLAMTARVVGSTQIRNVGTVGGALGSANPRGDLMTFLIAAGAEVLLASATSTRTVDLPGFLRDGCSPTELVTAIRVPRPSGPQTYLRIGGRQAAYQAVVSCALLVDRVREQVSCAVGGVGRTPLRSLAAEAFARDEVDWSTGTAGPAAARRFGELVASDARAVPPLPDDPRAPTEYRCHAAAVLAARAFQRCLVGPIGNGAGTGNSLGGI